MPILILALNLFTTGGCCDQVVTRYIMTALGGLDRDVKVDLLLENLEKWQICLWDKAFIGHFPGIRYLLKWDVVEGCQRR